MSNATTHTYWKIAFWILFVGWVVGAGMSMAHIHGGFLTNYLADVAFPPWYYIYLRGLTTNDKSIPRVVFFGNWFGISRMRAALSIFLVGAVAELLPVYWPGGPTLGVFDPSDLAAYAIGLLICFFCDRKG